MTSPKVPSLSLLLLLLLLRSPIRSLFLLVVVVVVGVFGGVCDADLGFVFGQR